MATHCPSSLCLRACRENSKWDQWPSIATWWKMNRYQSKKVETSNKLRNTSILITSKFGYMHRPPKFSIHLHSFNLNKTKYCNHYALRTTTRLSRLYSTSSLWCIINKARLTWKMQYNNQNYCWKSNSRKLHGMFSWPFKTFVILLGMFGKMLKKEKLF